MTEAQALIEIANAIEGLASAVLIMAAILWLMLICKNMSSNNSSALNKIAEQLKTMGRKGE